MAQKIIRNNRIVTGNGWTEINMFDAIKQFGAAVELPDKSEGRRLKIEKVAKEMLEKSLSHKIISFLPCTVSAIEWTISSPVGFHSEILQGTVSIMPLGGRDGTEEKH